MDELEAWRESRCTCIPADWVCPISRAAAKDPAKRELLSKKEDLESRIDLLKYQKAAMPVDEYKKQLSALLLELAQTQEDLDK